MVTLNFNDFYVLCTPVLLLFWLWVSFFKVNSNSLKLTGLNTQTNTNKVNSNNVFIGLYLYLIILNVLGGFFLRGKSSVLLYNHINLNNFTVNLLYIFFLVGLFLFFLLKTSTKKTNLVKSIDYLFSINNLILLLPYLFFVNTVFTFLFFLELVSVILFYKLISSKVWFKDSVSKNTLDNNIPQNFINMVFFQYWVTFFSTIFIVYFYIHIFYIYGTSDWYIIQFLNNSDVNTVLEAMTIYTRILLFVFLFSIFFKLGITPLHLFKVEVYKGLPYLSIFFYTTFYFIVFFIFFIFFLTDFLGGFLNLYYPLIALFVVLGSLYIITLLFDVNFLKAFFTYSTVINSVGFLIVLIASF